MHTDPGCMVIFSPTISCLMSVALSACFRNSLSVRLYPDTFLALILHPHSGMGEGLQKWGFCGPGRGETPASQPHQLCADITQRWGKELFSLALFPGPTQLSVTFSTEKWERTWYLSSREWHQDRKDDRKVLIVRERTGPRTAKGANVTGNLPS